MTSFAILFFFFLYCNYHQLIFIELVSYLSMHRWRQSFHKCLFAISDAPGIAHNDVKTSTVYYARRSPPSPPSLFVSKHMSSFSPLPSWTRFVSPPEGSCGTPSSLTPIPDLVIDVPFLHFTEKRLKLFFSDKFFVVLMILSPPPDARSFNGFPIN